MPPISRRRFIQLGALTGLSFYLGFPRLRFPQSAEAMPVDLGVSPIRDLTGAFSSTDFSGDEIHRAHEMLWDVEGYIRKKGGRPESFTEREVVVVGGGMAGLLSAHFLREHSPLLLEQAERMGGNSQGERFEGTAFSIGAAYITVPEEDSSIARTLAELELTSQLRKEDPKDSRVIFGGVKDLWNGETDPAARASAERVTRELERIYNEAYPEIPWSDGDPLSLEQLRAWDRKSAAAWLKEVDPNLHPHVEEYFQLYAWSSFAGSLEEISAAQFANFVAAEVAGVLALPGGNSAITDALHRKLAAQLPSGSLRTGCTVLEVKEVDGGVEVLFDNAKRQLERVRARTAVIAAPKYVASGIVKDASAAHRSFWRNLPFRAYVVANVLLKSKVPSPAYDLFCLRGAVPPAPRFGSPPDRAFADVIFASWAAQDQSPRSILTLYRPLPFEGARSTITSPGAHERTKNEIMRELPGILRDLKIAETDVEGVRLTRWGHSLPLARVGMLADGTLDRIGASIGRVHFANQDNFMNPAFETAFAAAEQAAELAKASLKS